LSELTRNYEGWKGRYATVYPSEQKIVPKFVDETMEMIVHLPYLNGNQGEQRARELSANDLVHVM
jgi:hypothetical protein